MSLSDIPHYRLEAGSELIATETDHPYAIVVTKVADVEAHLQEKDAQIAALEAKLEAANQLLLVLSADPARR